MAYTIMISEEQRAALVEVLKAADPKWTGSSKPTGAPWLQVQEAPLEYWVDMLEEMPLADAHLGRPDKPMVHGFCL